MPKPALVVIDLQNDYFPGGAFPLANADAALDAAETAIRQARAKGVPVVLVQHVARPAAGSKAPFFHPGSEGVQIHPRISAAAPDAPVVVKHFADAFDETTLGDTLQGLGATELLLCGMMTQNCVTHTALSRRADDYTQVTVLTDACATASTMLHAIALNALSRRVKLQDVAAALG